jgi:hypothetical protein
LRGNARNTPSRAVSKFRISGAAMKNVLAVVAAVLFSAYLVDQHYYQGYYFRNAGSVSLQMAQSFGLRR